MGKFAKTMRFDAVFTRKVMGLLALVSLAACVACFATAQPAQAYADDNALIAVYEQTGDEEPELIAEFTKAEFESLQSTGDAVSGLYIKGGTWYVATAATYVKLDQFLNVAGVSWGAGDTVKWGGDPAQNKAPNYLTYEENSQLKFYPFGTSTGICTGVARFAPMVLSITNSTSALTDGSSAYSIEAANVLNANSSNEVCTVMGSLSSELQAGTGDTVAGKRIWKNTDEITIIHAA
ncbi:hypothetical protein [Denitrobacterium detoxificans]|uniref:hypothetical protein n=1 Tax=Denitrobacterium detoxificans TaxID=79604 RepID=UPI0026F2106F|nr:hypothetical protein [Denitrobacterium detoxificans]MBE6465929.1 hypothetical protein [Denitrobacterium detoxificans]